jgi:hypothetical protein
VIGLRLGEVGGGYMAARDQRRSRETRLTGARGNVEDMRTLVELGASDHRFAKGGEPAKDQLIPFLPSRQKSGSRCRAVHRGSGQRSKTCVFLLPSARPAAHTARATGSVSGASTGAGQKVVDGELAPALDSSPTIRNDRHDRFERANRRSRKKHQHP